MCALAAPIAALSCVIAGCSSITPPTLRVVEARVADRTEDGLKLEFVIDAENANDEALPLRAARYSLRLDGDTVFTGSRSPQATLRRLGTQRITLPVVIPAAELLDIGPMPEYRLSGTLSYVTPGEISDLLFDYRIRRPKVSFSDMGRLQLLDEDDAAQDTGDAE